MWPDESSEQETPQQREHQRCEEGSLAQERQGAEHQQVRSALVGHPLQ